ncbi:unnamed protein product [Chrysoparadoxa australica]
MSMRHGLSVGGTTTVSSLSDQVKRFKPRTLPPKHSTPKKGEKRSFDRERGDNPAHEALTTKCIKVLVKNFERFPAYEGAKGVPIKFLNQISANLSTKLDPKIGALYVFDETYWKRRCIEELGWQHSQIEEHGLTWKQLFFEHHVSERLELFDPRSESFEDLIELLKACQDYVFSINVRQLLSHPDLLAVSEALPNLTHLEISYGVKRIGMKYERILFGMKISDASCLAKVVHSASNLTALVLQCNLIDDDLLRMLMTGLIRNSTITYLDVSHNRISNHGTRLLCKLLGDTSVLTSLNLADNQIHAEGGRYLGRALRVNESLLDLNLRLNQLTDEGTGMLLEGLCDNTTLTSLNLSGNNISESSCSTMSILLRDSNKRLAYLDLSCNNLQNDDVHLLRVAISSNTSLTSVDLRMNDVSNELPDLEAIEELVHKNELAQRAKARQGQAQAA